jgi:hypothetical protein
MKQSVFKHILSIKTWIFYGNYPIFYGLFINVSQIFTLKIRKTTQFQNDTNLF